MKILHLGLGHFHRSHQAWYVEKLNRSLSAAGESPWSITAFSMLKPDAAQSLRQLNFQYQLEQCEGESSTVDSINSITAAHDLKTETQILETLAADPSLGLVTITATEKAYSAPSALFDALMLLLEARRQAHAHFPLAIVSCDNLKNNSQTLQQAIEKMKPGFTQSQNVVFLNSMVDRIVPHSPSPDRLNTETFSQWLIESKGLEPHHPLKKLRGVGVQFVPDIAPYEKMKLRLLNAAHSLMAYWGINRDFQHVHEVIQDPQGLELVKSLWSEVIPNLDLAAGIDAEAYCRRLLVRFNNPRLPHKLSQIALDRDAKIPQRILPSIEIAKKRGTEWKTLAMVLTESKYSQ